MDLAVESPFTSLPHEILVELFSFIPTTSINNFYLVNSTHLKLFDTQHGLWEQLARKMFSWGASGMLTPTPQSYYSHLIQLK